MHIYLLKYNYLPLFTQMQTYIREDLTDLAQAVGHQQMGNCAAVVNSQAIQDGDETASEPK